MKPETAFIQDIDAFIDAYHEGTNITKLELVRSLRHLKKSLSEDYINI